MRGADFERLAEQIQQEAAESARNVLRRGQLKAATLWATRALDVAAERGDHKPMKSLLEATGAIRQRDDSDGRVQVFFGLQINADGSIGPLGAEPKAIDTTARISAIEPDAISATDQPEDSHETTR